MEKEILELKQKRAKLVAEARSVYEAAGKAGRIITGEEKVKTEKILADEKEMADQIKGMEQAFLADKELSASAGRKTDGPIPGEKAPDKAAQNTMKVLAEKLLSKKGADMQKYLDNLPSDLNQKHMEALRSAILTGFAPDESMALKKCETMGRKDYQIDLPTQGGYILPVEVSSNILLRLLNEVYMRASATILPLNSYAVEIPALDVEPTQPTPSGEVEEMASDSSGKLGKRKLQPRLMPIEVIIARDLLRFSPSFEGVIMDRVAKGFGLKEESLFMTGNGNGQPLGLFVSPGATGYAGIPTDRNTICGSATAPTFDGLKALKYGLKKQYRKNASFIMSREMVLAVQILKDSMGRYLWQESNIIGAPDMLLGHPVMESEYAPNTFTQGKAVCMFGDLSYYWIAQVLGFEVQPLLEKHALTNQVGFACRQWVDGQPMLSEAFRRGVLA